MIIKIAERLQPFSHTPGTLCVLPGTNLRLKIFPALIVVHDLSQAEPKFLAEIPIPAKGPVKEFTVQLDLEKGAIQVWGKSSQGYFLYRIFLTKHPFQIALEIKKGLSDWMPVPSTNALQVELILSLSNNTLPILTERLSLGSHKSQDWDMVKRRNDLVEILPTWLRLGQMIQPPQNFSYEGTAAFLKICQNASKMEAYTILQNLFNTGFEGILSPRLKDEQHQGFELTEPDPSSSPLFLLSEGAKVIRSLFIKFIQNNIHVLPSLPPEFHCGRFLQIRCEKLGVLDFEWSKKTIRRMIFRSETNESMQFHFPNHVQKFRLNGQMNQIEMPIEVQKGKIYIFDRFQK